MNHKGSQVTITLPSKEYVINAPTENFLVLIAQDNERIIMPQFLTYVISMIQKGRKSKGIKFKAKTTPNLNLHVKI